LKPCAWAFALIPCLFCSPALAVPEDGVYAESGLNGFANLQTVADHGILQIDYVPHMDRFSGGGSMQVLQAAARYPAPIIESGLTLRALLGYQEQWAYYNGLEDTYGGIDVGLSSSLDLGTLPWIGDFFRPITLYAYGFGNKLIFAKANGQLFAANNVILPSYGAGASIKVPSGGAVYLGLETQSLPYELGSGATSFSNPLQTFNQYVVGYRW
jgi:hypothetical protein